MGQRTTAAGTRRRRSAPPQRADRWVQTVFCTDLGWCAVWGSPSGVAGLTIGHVDAQAVRSAVARALSEAGRDEVPESDWNPGLRRALEDYARGIPVDFRSVTLDLRAMTPFRRRVLDATRRIPYGRTATYGELAARAGSPGAARAVGAAMATNRFPLLVPCHRVVASGGAIGGFSAPQGIALKRRLLQMEAAAAAG